MIFDPSSSINTATAYVPAEMAGQTEIQVNRIMKIEIEFNIIKAVKANFKEIFSTSTYSN